MNLKRCLVFLALLYATPSTFAGLYDRNEEMSTRFGKAIIKDNHEGVQTLFAPNISNDIQGNSYLMFQEKFTLGSRDVLLIANVGGSACPVVYRFVALGKDFSRYTTEFGSCAELSSVKKVGNKIVIVIPTFQGPFEKQQPIKKITYEYDIKDLKINGKVIN